jgi:hypothetical protein
MPPNDFFKTNGALNLPPPKTEAEMQAMWAANRASEIKYASDAAGEFLRHAIRHVNEQLGPATQYPAVVAALVEASATGMAASGAVDVSEVASALSIGLGEIASAIHIEVENLRVTISDMK